MIRSMTGFGRGEASDGKRIVTCEIRSVNHRYADIYIKIPRRYSFAEEAIKKIVKETVHRGKVEVSVMIVNLTEEDTEINLNTGLADQYYRCLNQLNENFDLGGKVTLEMLASMPDIMRSVPVEEDEEVFQKVVDEAVYKACKAHDQMRMVEGEKLKQDLEMRGDLIRNLVDRISERAPKVSMEYKDRLRERICELVNGTVEIPEDRITLEAAIFADKANITEELVRLNSHIDQMQEILSGDGTVGKKLDFLVQEMNREANTIGSKSNDRDITNYMLELKSEVEKIREQVQNIE